MVGSCRTGEFLVRGRGVSFKKEVRILLKSLMYNKNNLIESLMHDESKLTDP